ncbi:MAG: hypothetical protein ACPGN3_15780, partial [Opitutales bacterium]
CTFTRKLLVHFNRKPTVCFSFLCFTGCLQIPERSISEGTQHVLGEGEGYLVGSFTWLGRHPGKLAQMFGDDFRYSAYGYYFRSLDPGNEFRGDVGLQGDIFFATYDSDYKLDDGQGAVYAIAVPAGRYEFYNFSFFQNSGAFQNTFSSREDFSYPFEIEAGECIYIGEIAAIHEFGKNLLGMTIPAGGYHAFFDERARDIPLIRKKYPFLDDYDIDYVDVFGQGRSATKVKVDVAKTPQGSSNVQLEMLELVYEQGKISEEQYLAKRSQLLQENSGE